jgi:hypothetical protein
MLKEGVSDHCHEGVTVKALPGTFLEVVEAAAITVAIEDEARSPLR